MKADISALKSQLRSLQKKKPTFKLSERTIVDILQKVIKRGKIKLIHGSNGREYLTERKLMKEISDLILRFDGCISKQQLVNELEIERSTVEEYVNRVIASDPAVQLIEEKVVNTYFLSKMRRRVEALLEEQGKVSVSQISSQFPFSIEFLKGFFSSSVSEGLMKAEMLENTIYNTFFIEREQKRIRPCLIAATSPVKLSELIQKHNLDQMLVDRAVKQLIETGQVKGELVRNTFVPSIYEECQSSFVKGSIESMHFLEYSQVKKIGISDPVSYIKKLFGKKGIYLSDTYIAEGIQDQIREEVQEKKTQGKVINFSNLVYFEVSDEDIKTILESLKINYSSFILKNKNLIPKSLIEGFISESKTVVKEEAAQKYNEFLKLKKKLSEDKVEPEEDEPKKKKGKKGKAAKKAPKTVNLDLVPTDSFKTSCEDRFARHIGADELELGEETVSEVFEEHIHNTLEEQFKDTVTDMMKAKKSTSTDPKQLVNKISTEYLDLLIVKKHIEKLISDSKGDESLKNSLKLVQTVLSKKRLSSLFNEILAYQYIAMNLEIDFSKLENPNLRQTNIAKLDDKDLVDIFSTLAGHLQKKEFVAFMNYLSQNGKMLSASFKSLEKKFEKSVVAAELAKANSAMAEGGDSTVVLHHVAAALLLQRGVYLGIQPENWTAKVLLDIVLMGSVSDDILPELKTVLACLEGKKDADSATTALLKKVLN